MYSLYDYLDEYSQKNIYPLHMPGHKRNADILKNSSILSDVFSIDITEIDGFDNLHNAQGIIKDAQEHAAKVFKSKTTHFLINGSTAGILSAISSVSNLGDTIVIGRNAHKAAYNAAYINKLDLEYVFPQYIEDYGINGQILESDIKEALTRAKSKSKKVAAVFITSPTYDGIVSDIGKIAELVHNENIPLIVDEAHGAHFGFNDHFPNSALSYGADLVIQSVHKTLPAPTQTALIHNNSSIISDVTLKKYLGIYQSSSPSYILMAGIDKAIHYMEEYGDESLERVYELRNILKSELKDLRNIKLCPYTEPGKLVIAINDGIMTGHEVADLLRNEFLIEVEMASINYVLGILSVGDTKEGIIKLANALRAIDDVLNNKNHSYDLAFDIEEPVVRIPFYKAYDMDSREVNLKDAEGKVCASVINLYPPGIPILLPGEEITKRHISMLEQYMLLKYDVLGINNDKVKVIWES